MKITLNPDEEVVKTVKEGLKLKDGYCTHQSGKETYFSCAKYFWCASAKCT